MQEKDIANLVEYCKKYLDFDLLAPPNEYDYSSLPLCVIDAVRSGPGLLDSLAAVLRWIRFD